MNIDEGQGYLSWSGNLTHAELEVVSNIEPMKNKVFNAIALLPIIYYNHCPNIFTYHRKHRVVMISWKVSSDMGQERRSVFWRDYEG